MQNETKAMSEFKADIDNNEEVQEVADLAKELYNKDLRPVVKKKEPLTKKSKEKIIESITNTGEYVAPKRDKVTQQVDSMKKVVEAHDTLVEEITKIAPVAEAVVEGAKPKKKRKYYPRKK